MEISIRNLRRFLMTRAGRVLLALAFLSLVSIVIKNYFVCCAPVSVRTFTPFSLSVQPDILDLDVPYQPCPPVRDTPSSEGTQVDTLWTQLFSDLGVRTASEVVDIYEKSYLSYLPLTFLRKTVQYEVPPSEDYHYQVGAPTANQTHVCIGVEESVKNGRVGGSNFQFVVRGTSSIDVTRSIGYNNGTYLLCAKYFEPQLRVTVRVFYRGFLAYIRSCYVSSKISQRLFAKKLHVRQFIGKTLIEYPKDSNLSESLLQQDDDFVVSKINTTEPTKNTKFIERYAKSHEVCHILRPENSRWIVHNNHWRLLYKEENVVAYASPIQINRCLMEYDSVTIVGDSHLRHLYYYVMTFLTGPDLTWSIKEHKDLRGGHLSFFWKPVGNEFNDYLDTLRQELLDGSFRGFSYRSKPQKRGHVILMNSGHHDFEWAGKVCFRNPALFYTNKKRTLALIKDIVAIARTLNVKLFWISHPPFQFSYSMDLGCRNNFQLAAANQWLLPRLAEAGITVINIFDLTYVLNDVNVCNGHYLCVDPRVHKIIGDPGRTMADLILTQICPETGSH